MTQQELSTSYQPAAIERRWYETWERRGLFHAEPDPDKKPYTIVIPPPNVTGALHIGHAFGHTLQDAFVRRARMMGYAALWLPGTDHAGIATQNVVERELAKEGLDRKEVGREAFVERVWAWKEQYGGRILEQMKRLGDSCDWERERFTMDEGLSRAVRTVFVRWFDDGLIYRGWRIINWCPFHMTALSDVEVEHEDTAGEIVTFNYELSDGSGILPVATTRVETMLGDTGIAVHPEDPRYASLVGKRVLHPFFPDRVIPVVADDAVDPEFGTGAVKVTPAHDPVDFDIGERHGLDKINILDGEARLNEAAGPFAGLDRYAARAAVFEKLDELGAVVNRERPYVHPVGHCYRCHTEVEPWLSEQWFLKMKPLVGPALEAVRDGRIRIEPRRFVKSYTEWMENIRDWCISRQIWWGHRIPVWYCDECDETFAALEDPTECRKCSSDRLRQDTDVLDTWFSSQLWPFSTLGWPDETPDLEYFYPTTLMATGYEILYLWVARMITSGLYFIGDVPFKEVLIHGIVRDFEGKKMSKSVGNVIDPLDMIDRYGADALRFSLAFAAVPGNDTNVSEKHIEGARRFANKIWNASRFVLLSLGDQRPELNLDDLAIEDRWILSRLDRTIYEIDKALGTLNWAEASRVLRHFIWTEYCDWYVELTKPRFERESEKVGGVLLYVLDNVLRLLHPVMPFVTEELWSRLRPQGGSVMRAEWPSSAGNQDPDAEGVMETAQAISTAISRFKAERKLSHSERVIVRVGLGRTSEDVVQRLKAMNQAIAWRARAQSVEFLDDLPVTSTGARVMAIPGIEVEVELKGRDTSKEKERLEREIEKAKHEIRRADSKLANSEFVAKAPAQLVQRERDKRARASESLARLERQLEHLAS